jgi:hypothetical protein
MTLYSCHRESFGGVQDKLREGSDFEIESLLQINVASAEMIGFLTGAQTMQEG